jgi:hypothetical protein
MPLSSIHALLAMGHLRCVTRQEGIIDKARDGIATGDYR